MQSKVLVVNHKQTVKQELNDLLAKEYEVINVADAYEALAALEADTDIKIMLLELMLPKMSGLELVQKIRSNNIYKELVIIVVTEVGNTHEEITALGIGADDYICQPISAEVVAARIKHILYNKEILKSSESRFGLQRNLLDATETAIYVVDAINHNLLYANNAASKMLQAKNDTYAGRKCYEYFFNRKYPCENCKLFIAHTNESKTEVYVPKVAKTMSVRIHLMEWLTRPAYVVYMTDITEEKRARQLAEERYQKELRRRYRVDMDFMAYLVINVTTGAVIEHDPHGFPVPTIYPGQPETEFIERVLPTVIDYEKRKEFTEMLGLDNLRRSFQEGKTVLSIDYRRYARNMKDIMWARSTIQLMEDPQSKDLIAFLYTYDINENKMMQEVITKAVNYDYNMIAYINLFSETAKMYTSNGFGIQQSPKQEFDYQNAVENYIKAFVVSEEREAAFQKMALTNIRKRLAEDDFYEFDITLIDAMGIVKKSRIRYVNLDKIYGMVLWTDRDITHIIDKETAKQKQLLGQVEELRSINSIKNDYLTSFGARIRSPLKDIIGSLKKLSNSCARDENKQEFDRIKAQLSQITDIINDVTDISALESQKMKFSEVQFTISDLLNTVMRDVKRKYAAKKIHVEFVEQLVHDTCLGEYKATYKLLYNILDNAFKYSDNNSKVQVIVYELPFCDHAKALYRFIVKDTGCGMDAELLRYVFTPFHAYGMKADNNVSSGLGLAIAKILAERLGGSIAIDSKLGAGTTVTIDLQIEFVHSMLVETSPQEVVHEQQDPIREKRFLWLQNNRLEHLALRKLLENKGAEVHYASTGAEALVALAAQRGYGFDYIFIDMDTLATDDKLELLQALKGAMSTFETMVFVLCSHLNQEEKKAILANGITEVLFKPLKITTLIEAITEFKK